MATPPQRPNFEELLPHDRMAEQAVLGSVIIRNDLLAPIADLLIEEDFFSPAHRHIYTAMQGMAAQETPIDELTLARWLTDRQLFDKTGGADYLLQLTQNTPVPENADYYAQIVREKSQLREIILTAQEIAKRGQEDGAEDVSTFLAESTERLRAIDARTSQADYARLKEVLLTNFEHLEKLSESPQAVTGLPTGFTELDELTRGLQRGDLIILAARPSMGKTALAVNIALHGALQTKQPILLFSLEMPREHIAMRLVCSEAKVNSRRLWVGDLEQDDWDKLLEATTRMMDTPLFIDDHSGISPMHIRKVVRQVVQEHGSLGLVVVDYLQLMQSTRRIDSREQEISEISRSLKALAKEFSVPVLALSQLNRDLERRADKRPMMADLRESGALEQDADLILFIYRDEVYHENTEDKGIAEIHLAKHRNGETGMRRLAFIGQYTKFANLAVEPV
ncbi:MAG TPA: replicative DNA helicase [Deltaproteobacteria bacterium]|jgi:replicative DNA helicase|nr:replicative DNA helicase [Deltaproteobacteria bacterium]HIF68615.1 replicative DNA helicase [Candidatus Lambdaproteobacteria bacterium]HIL15648.1 replicative DNA helicase [Deltaproteobacteria bacterium]